MKITKLRPGNRSSLKQALQKANPLLAVAILFCASHAWAAAPQLTWDPLGNAGTISGSGNWDTTAANKVWTNVASGGPDVAWTQTSTTVPLNSAIFNGPDAAPGTYVVTLDATQVSLTNVSFINNNGYTFTGPNAIELANNAVLAVANNVLVNFNCNMAGSATAPAWTLGTGATINVAGNLLNTPSQQLSVGGPASSVINLTGANNVPGIFRVLAPVNVTSGSLLPNSSLYIGYGETINGTSYTTGSLSIANATLGGAFQLLIGRANGTGTLTIGSGTTATVGSTAAKIFAINYDGSAGSSGTINMNGGSLTVGTSSLDTLASAITFFNAGSEVSSATATLNQTGGTIITYGGIEFGVVASATGTATLTQSGGSLYIGAPGIVFGAGSPATTITLSGGTVGAMANWSSTLPMTLGTTGGNVTFQCADNVNNSHNILLSGALTDGGLGGGLNVTGPGTLTLSGANNYSGSTVVRGGTLAIVTRATPMVSGPVTVDGTSGSPTVSLQVSQPGQEWSTGTLTCQNPNTTLTADFNFSALSPSTSFAPIQVTGNVAFTATPRVTVEGSSIAVGTYPLITCTGSISGTPPTAVTITGSATVGSIQTIGKTVSLVVTSSTYNPALTWAVGNGLWDINVSENWKQNGNPAFYTDGNAVLFDDSASGSSPITVTLNVPVNPLEETFNNTAKSYTIAGTGSITGSGALSVLGGGTVTLAGANTYTGGTTLSAGQLNINNGGNASTPSSAIGAGTLTIKNGTTIDNTSGSDVTLQPAISETWSGNFTYAGSANNFSTGAGQVTMNQSISLGVSAGNFTVGGVISDNGNNFQLIKTGNGALTLAGNNTFGGGLTLSSGQLNLGSSGAPGSGNMVINGGTLDNSSGGQLTLGLSGYNVNGGFTFLGSANLDLGNGTITIPSGAPLTVDVVANTLYTDGNIVSGNTRVIKSGNGTWVMQGTTTSANNFQLEVSAGTVQMAKIIGQTIGPGSIGLTVDTGALVIDEDSYQIHSDSPGTPVPVNLAGGTFDINGNDENIDELSISSSGTLQDSGASGTTSTLNLISGHTASLNGTNCQFNIVNAGAFLAFDGPIGGTGTLVTIGLGTLTLASNNTYTGGTVVSNGTVDVASPAGSIAGNVSVLANGSSVGTLQLDTTTSMASTASLSVASGATVNLTYSGTQNINALYVGGIQQPAGVYGTANNPGNVFIGTGTLTIASGPAFTITPSISGNQFMICWNSVAGATYNVYTATSLNSPQTWTKVNSSPIAATPPMNCYPLGSIVGQPQLFVTVMQ